MVRTPTSGRPFIPRTSRGCIGPRANGAKRRTEAIREGGLLHAEREGTDTLLQGRRDPCGRRRWRRRHGLRGDGIIPARAGSSFPGIGYTCLGVDRIRPGIRSGYRDAGSFALDDVLLAGIIRARGEQEDGRGLLVEAEGSSPRARGADGSLQGLPVRAGIIPARGGSSVKGMSEQCAKRDHPRARGEQYSWRVSWTEDGRIIPARGEQQTLCTDSHCTEGSPPRARGAGDGN